MQMIRRTLLSTCVAAMAAASAGAVLAQTKEVKVGYALAVNSHYGAAAQAWADAVLTHMFYIAHETEGRRLEGRPVMIAATSSAGVSGARSSHQVRIVSVAKPPITSAPTGSTRCQK